MLRITGFLDFVHGPEFKILEDTTVFTIPDDRQSP
jgi:hypothetical protein